MPSSPRSRSNAGDNSGHLRAYLHHGVDLSERGSQAVGDCPFCGGAGKFTVQIDTGLWRCWVCGGGTPNGGGNPLMFIRLLHECSVESTSADFADACARDRRLCDASTVSAWGVCPSIVSGEWLVPGYGTDGKLNQLYRRAWVGGRWRLLPTPGIWLEGKSHALHLPVGDFNQRSLRIEVCEGPWDGMALWETVRGSGLDSSNVTVVAVPGCNVWRDEWTEMCKGKRVTLWFDSDHPRAVPGGGDRTHCAGFDGVRRVVKKLYGTTISVRYLRWGADGWDPSKPSGWDVRDALSGGDGNTPPTLMVDRRAALNGLLARVEDVPTEWLVCTPSPNGRSAVASNIEPEHCQSWSDCEAAWANAMEWRRDLADAITVMLATAASTNQAGDNQLFLQVIADPGSAKTRLCKGLLVSSRCKLLVHLKSFHSGWKGEDGKDCSLVSRINGLCLVTPEADALSIGMSWDQLNSQMRQIFDGDSGNTYGNSDEDRQYKGLRSPWIQAGTPALMDKDQSRLGDRFLRVRIDEPPQDVKRAILLSALRNERAAVLETSDGTESSIIPLKLRKAYALTGGYVDWLRANIENQISLVEMDESAEQRCCDLAELTADMRARPNMDPKKHEVHHTKELGSRLAGQFGRLSLCLSVVLNKRAVDTEVMRIVRKVAMDTAHGHSLNIVQWLCGENPRTPGRSYQSCGGIAEGMLLGWTGMTQERLTTYLLFLRKIGVVLLNNPPQSSSLWMLTERVYELYLRVLRD